MKKFLNTYVLLCFLLAGAVPLISKAETYNFYSSNYEEAKKAESNIKFDMASTKLGIFTTHFTGFVKKFSLSGEKRGIQFTMLQLNLK